MPDCPEQQENAPRFPVTGCNLKVIRFANIFDVVLASFVSRVTLFCPWWRHQMETISALLILCDGNLPHRGQWRETLMFSLICAWTNGWANNRDAGDFRRHRANYDVTVMLSNDKMMSVGRLTAGKCLTYVVFDPRIIEWENRKPVWSIY